ncbi:MAG: alpha-L-fucosidase [Akkermansiaceae bacterium]
MKPTLCFIFLLAFVVIDRAASQQPSPAFVSDFTLKKDDITVLMAVDAELADGLKPWRSGGHGKFFITGWKSTQQKLKWNVVNKEMASYNVAILVQSQDDCVIIVEVTAAGRTIRGNLPVNPRRWQRVTLDDLILLPEGESEMSVRLVPADGSTDFNADVHAVELVLPLIREDLDKKASDLRADAEWFRQARYGVMVHWTSQSMPLKGEPKSYEEAVNEFDVELFANQMQATGAGFVVFTTSHAYQYFPAPLKSLDRILPGRTTRRDLVAELAEELKKQNMKLFLYYHIGAHDDSKWLNATRFWDTDTSVLFNNWQSIVREVGERYGETLAGWWFDDGITNYYYRSAPWEALARAAKAGNPRRLISFNAWALNNPTQFHDFCTGEACENPAGIDGLLTPKAKGLYPSGTHAGLQASACLVAESDWIHRRPNAAPARPKWNATQLSELLRLFMANKNVPIFNLEVTQEGNLGAESIALFREVSRRLR